jgi:small subunit ribosomal protein S11
MAKKIEEQEVRANVKHSEDIEKKIENAVEKVEEAEEALEEAIEEEAEEEKGEGKSAVKKKEKDIEAVLNIYTSFNNTIAHVTDSSGRTIAKVTGGMVTKHSRLKANPTIAMFIAKRISENMKEKGIKSLYVRIRAETGSTGPGPGANAIIKSLSREGFKIINILDTTRVPRGGPKKQGGRRGRRV